MIWWALIYPCTKYIPSSQCQSSLYVYLSPEVQSLASNFTINGIKPVGYAWYISMSLFQGLSWIYIYLLVTKYYVMFFTNVVTVSLPIRRHPLSAFIYNSCKHFSTYPGTKNVRVKTYIALSSFYRLPRITIRRVIWSEIQSAHLKTKGLR